MRISDYDNQASHGPKTAATNAAVASPRRRILLLQGPVGPFFSELEAAAEHSGYSVVRFGFNPADRLYRGKRSFPYKGSIEDWQRDFPDILAEGKFDAVVAFGSSRPGHIVAREVCADRKIPFLSLEEGYIRPGFITAEWGGNNADSPLAGQIPSKTMPGPDAKSRAFRGAGAMARQGALYYTVRSLLSSKNEKSFFHRNIDLLAEAQGWMRNGWKSLWHSRQDKEKCNDLIARHREKYFLVPLQVPTDANLQGAACGWTVRRLADAVLASFAASAPPDTRLTFKIHPMARGHGRMEKEIRSVARGNGISDRVDILETGSLGHLTRHCAGMITINSTSGLAAIAHGRPLLVVGRSIYSHPELAICADGNPDFDTFWENGLVADESLRKSFLAWISREALVSGSFYTREGRKIAVRGLLDKISVMLDLCNGK